MNINTKTLLASTLLTALLAGTSAFAEDRDNLFAWELDAAPTETVEMQKVSFVTPSVATDNDSVLSGQK